jgi:hypothetical protein
MNNIILICASVGIGLFLFIDLGMIALYWREQKEYSRRMNSRRKLLSE